MDLRSLDVGFDRFPCFWVKALDDGTGVLSQYQGLKEDVGKVDRVIAVLSLLLGLLTSLPRLFLRRGSTKHRV